MCWLGKTVDCKHASKSDEHVELWTCWNSHAYEGKNSYLHFQCFFLTFKINSYLQTLKVRISSCLPFHDNLPEIGILATESDQIGLFQVITTQRVFLSQNWLRYENNSIFSKKVENFQKKGLGWLFAPIWHIWSFHLQVLVSKSWNFRFGSAPSECVCGVQIRISSPFWATSRQFHA